MVPRLPECLLMLERKVQKVDEEGNGSADHMAMAMVGYSVVEGGGKATSNLSYDALTFAHASSVGKTPGKVDLRVHLLDMSAQGKWVHRYSDTLAPLRQLDSGVGENANRYKYWVVEPGL